MDRIQAPALRRRIAVLVIGLLFFREGVCLAQLPAVPAVPAVPAAPAGVPTIWNKLGFRGGERIRNFFRNLINRRGNFPGLEGKPKLTSLTDPANKESDNPAIKEAANAKAEQDGAGQKVKAIKYLATLGCSRNGCFPGVKDALLAAFDDCTEEVRYEAVKAFIKTTGNKCNPCRSTCCDKDTTDKLYEMAYGRDDQGCYLEISPRVRREAKKALMACCTPGEPGPEQPLPTEGPREGPDEPTPPEEPQAPTDDSVANRDSAFSFVSSLFSPQERSSERNIDRFLQRRFAPTPEVARRDAPRRVSSTYAPDSRSRPRPSVASRPGRSDPLDIANTDPSEAPLWQDGDDARRPHDSLAATGPRGDIQQDQEPRWRAMIDRFGSEGRYEQTHPVEPYSRRPTRPYAVEQRLPPVENDRPQYEPRDAPRYSYEQRDTYEPQPARTPADEPPTHYPPAADEPYRPGSTGQTDSVASSLPPSHNVIEQTPLESEPPARRTPPRNAPIESIYTPPMPADDERPVGPSPQPKAPPVVPSRDESPREPKVWPPAEPEPELAPSPKPIANLEQQDRVAVRFGPARPLVRYGAVRAVHQEPAEPAMAERPERPQPQPRAQPNHLRRAEYTQPRDEPPRQAAQPAAPRPRARLGTVRAMPGEHALPRVAARPRDTARLGRPGRYRDLNGTDERSADDRHAGRYDPAGDRYADRYDDRDANPDEAAEVRLNDPRISSISIDDRDAGRARIEHVADERGRFPGGSAQASDVVNQEDDRNENAGYLRSRVRSWFR